MKGCIKEWRNGGMGKKEYNRRHKDHEKLLKEKREMEKKRFMEEVEKAVQEGREWEVINKERKKGKPINRKIKIEEWTRYFMDMSGGTGYKVRGEGRRMVREDDVEDVTREEVDDEIDKLKRNKAVGKDEMEGEGIKYGGEKVRRVVWEVVNEVWKGNGWPEEWKTGLIVPLVKKGEGEKIEEYRGITLMPVSYKVYAEVLRKRLEKEVEEKGGIPHNQAGFRKGMGTMDHIYIHSIT